MHLFKPIHIFVVIYYSGIFEVIYTKSNNFNKRLRATHPKIADSPDIRVLICQRRDLNSSPCLRVEIQISVSYIPGKGLIHWAKVYTGDISKHTRIHLLAWNRLFPICWQIQNNFGIKLIIFPYFSIHWLNQKIIIHSIPLWSSHPL